MEIFVRAMDGDYFAIEKGKPTGINPFQFKDTPKLREFLNDLVITCGTDENNTCSSEEQNQIKNAIDIVMSLPFEDRRFGSLLHSIPDRGVMSYINDY
jgi:type IV secretion system protein VirB4